MARQFDDATNPAELDEGAEQQGVFAKLSWFHSMPYWGVSAVLHLIVILILSIIVFESEKPPEKEVQVVVKVQSKSAPKKPAYDPTVPRAMKKTPKVPGQKTDKKPIVSKRDPDEVTTDIPLGTSLENITNVNIANDISKTGINDAIGVGGGAAGAYGERWGKGRLVDNGGSAGSEEAVRAALEWLRRHQHADGHWSCHDFTEMCDKEKPCANDPKVVSYSDGRGDANYDVGVTGLAMLAFLGYAHTHRDGDYPEYTECMLKAMQWMLQQQIKDSDPQKNGIYGKIGASEEWVYNHAIASLAMAELLFLSRDKLNLQKSVQAAIDYIFASQNPGRGWRYGFRPGVNDTSVTGWMVLAVKTAKACSETKLLTIPQEKFTESFQGALAWFDNVTSKSNQKAGYQAPGDPGSGLLKLYPEPYPFSKKLSCMTAVAVLCRLFAGEKKNSEAVKGGVALLMAAKPEWRPYEDKRLSTINIYYWYYASYALFQYGGSQWKEWNEAMQEALIDNQRRLGDEDGSWDPIDEWGIIGGRVYTTAIGAMTLEVYYRYERAGE
ncbi:MAG: prenyltransferase/squalene oxidase repeat-containing protein [Planctomycetota bacterium]